MRPPLSSYFQASEALAIYGWLCLSAQGVSPECVLLGAGLSCGARGVGGRGGAAGIPTTGCACPIAPVMRDGTFSSSPVRREAAERHIAQGLALAPKARTRIAADGLASDPEIGGRAMYEDLTTDLRSILATIKTPTLGIYALDPTMVFPDGTKPTPEAADDAFRTNYRTMPKLKLVRIDDTRHFIISGQPERPHEQPTPFLAATAAPVRR